MDPKFEEYKRFEVPLEELEEAETKDRDKIKMNKLENIIKPVTPPRFILHFN